MQLAAADIMSLRGTEFVLDSRLGDALATYARLSAEDAGVAPQAWVRKTWNFEAYEAKAILRGDVSKPQWERILKHPNGGWTVALPVVGAVIGQPINEFFRDQTRRAAREAERAQEHQRLAEIAYRRLADESADPRQDRQAGSAARSVGAQEAGRLAEETSDLDQRSFAPHRRRT